MEKINLKNSEIKIYPNFFDCKEKVIIPILAHGSKIIEIITGEEDLKNCDAIFTKSGKFILGIKTADCASVCFDDGDNIGIAHIGWAGLCTDLVDKMLENFNKDNLLIFISPFLSEFEIQKDFCYEEILMKFGEEFFDYKESKIYFNFKKALLSILPKEVILDERNTKDDLSLPSNRRNKTKERLLTTIKKLK